MFNKFEMKGKTYMIFFAIVFLVNFLVNLFIFSRTRALFPAGTATSWILTILFWLLAFAYVIGRFAERADVMALAEPFVKIGSWWLGAMVYLTLMFLLADILRGVNSLLNISEFFRFSWASEKGKIVVMVVYSLSAIILISGYLSARIPTINRVSFQIDKTVPASKQKVVLVSDIHLGMMISNGKLEKMVQLVNNENADLVLLAGDVFDEDLGPVIQNNMGDLLKNLRAKHGVFAVLGNHEFYGNATAAHEYLENHNITVLRDSVAILTNGIAIVGREDITAERMYGKPRKSLEELLSGVNLENPVFMLDHQPYKLAEVAEHSVDLQVSGHTHNGQMWPFNYITGALFEISKGYGKIKNTHFYVSSGYGTWGPPIRTNSRAEIVVMEISRR
jgi:predicted MPP superfamily phosphohydrolase